MSWYKSKADFENAIGRAVLESDGIPLPPSVFSAEYRKGNPTFQLRNALEHIWKHAAEDQDVQSATREQVGELISGLSNIDEQLGKIQQLAEKVDEPMSDEERHQLANEIAAQVDSARIDIQVHRQ